MGGKLQLNTVSEVTRHIKQRLEDDPWLGDLWVEGETSNFHRASSGHCYFTLQDDQAEIRCVMWRNDARWLDWQPQQGDRAEAHGQVSVYERGGAYQLYVDRLQQGGIGQRWREFLALKERLAQEGLFAEERKRPLPVWPRTIGVVTSATGAALRDIQQVLTERYPVVQVLLSPSLVQGDQAPRQIVAALKRLNARQDVDVIIVARGGGSVEDLWAWNDERVARAIASSRLPVVSGVGHETDLTITDFAVDLRTPTPSAAAAAVVPDQRELRDQLAVWAAALDATIEERLSAKRQRLEYLRRLLAAQSPEREIGQRRQAVDELLRRAQEIVDKRLALCRAQLDSAVGRLQAIDPRSVLARGYAIVEDRASGARIASVDDARRDQELAIHLADGSLGARVTEKTQET